jgi:lycopene cyclase domain-containing protein
MSLYFILLIASAGIPVLLSFDKRLRFYTKWRFVFPSIFIVAAVYIFFDSIFTKNGVWGFNPNYLSGIYFLGLPLEEILFFIAIPYASLFLHYAFIEYFPQIELTTTTSKLITYLLLALSFILVVLNTEKTYTFYVFIKVGLVLLFSLFDKNQAIQRFYVTFLIILIPFILVNGILTGSGIADEVVWYNNTENMGIRFFTIPAEDFGYAFSLILFNLLLIDFFEKKLKIKHADS